MASAEITRKAQEYLQNEVFSKEVETPLYHRLQGRTLFDQPQCIRNKLGYFQETQTAKTFRAQSGLSIMKKLMEDSRTTPPLHFIDQPIAQIKDYITGTTTSVPEGEQKKNISLPTSNVIQFILTDNIIINVRPSGTEPKIKFYIFCHCQPGEPIVTARLQVQKKIDSISKALNELLSGV